VKGAGTLKE